jgi:hypothetical protein
MCGWQALYRTLANDSTVDEDNDCTRASSSSTLHQGEIITDMATQTVRPYPTSGGINENFKQIPGTPSQCSTFCSSATDLLPRNSPRVTNVTTGADARDSPSMEGKDTREISRADLEEHDFDPQSPRKSIPPQWMTKNKGPLLATAQRAKEREARKQKPHGDLPIESSAKTVRGAHSSIDLGMLCGADQTTFLTKDTAAAVESDITSQSFIRTPKTLRHARSKSVLKTPLGSPVRNSPGQHFTVKVTRLSPTRATAAHGFGLDGAPQSIAKPTDPNKYPPNAVSSAGSTPFASASQSPVSSGSVQSFMTANVLHNSETLDLDLTDTGGNEQMNKSELGTKSLPFAHHRGKSEPHVRLAVAGGKTPSSKPCPPKLSLKIPHSKSVSTDRGSLFTLVPASSCGSDTPVSPSQSSRIPRMFSLVKNEQERSSAPTASQLGTIMRHSKSVKNLNPAKDTKPTHGTVRSFRETVQPAIANNGKDESRLSAAFIDHHDAPLPKTPTISSLRLVRTVDSTGATPILSRGPAAPVEKATSPISAGASTMSDDVTITSTPPTDGTLVQGHEDKHRLVNSYLEHTDQMEKPPMAPLVDESFSMFSKLTVTVVSNLTSSGVPDKLAQFPITTEDCTAANEIKYTSRSISTATANDMMIERDPAIIFHRKKSDAAGMIPMIASIQAHASPLSNIITHSVELGYTLPCPFPDNCVASVTSTGTDSLRMTQNRSDNLPIHTSRQELNESEASQKSVFASNLRATAPVFEPQRPNTPIMELQQSQPLEITQHQQPIMLFDPFALDMNGIPWYHYMYPVPNTPYLRKTKNRKHIRPKSRGATNGSSPTKAERNVDRQVEINLAMSADQTKDASVTALVEASTTTVNGNKGLTNMSVPAPRPSPLQTSVPRGQEPHSEELPTDVKRSSKETSPFADQMDSVTRRAPVQKDGTLGRATRPIDWSSIHNVRSGFHSRPSLFAVPKDPYPAVPFGLQGSAHAGVGLNGQAQYEQLYHRRQPYHRRPGGNGLYDNFSPAYQGRNPHAAAGVPLHATAPFPTPLPPPGPRTSVVGCNSKEHFSYDSPDNKEPCGEIIIESAIEWGGGPICNKCAESEGDC